MALGGKGYIVVAFAYVFLVLSTISILLRCYVRLKMVKKFAIDDAFALLAWALFVVNLAFVVTAAYHGTGQHFADLPPEEIPIGLKWWWLCEPVFVLSTMAIKFSIGILLLRIAQQKIHRVVLWIGIVVMEAYSLFFFFIFIFQCNPSSYFWTRVTGAKGSCISLDVLVDITYAYSAIACVTDWLFAMMPLFILWNVQMNKRTKASVGILIAMGASASIATVIRIPYLKGFRDTTDFLYATTDVAIWTTIELGVGICAASLATIRPLLRKFIGGGTSSGQSEGGPSTMAWPKKHHGYVRSISTSGNELVEDYELGNKGGANSYAKSDVESQAYFEREGANDIPQNPTITIASSKDLSGFNAVELGLKEEMEEREKIWRGQGIVKTTAVVHTHEARFSG